MLLSYDLSPELLRDQAGDVFVGIRMPKAFTETMLPGIDLADQQVLINADGSRDLFIFLFSPDTHEKQRVMSLIIGKSFYIEIADLVHINQKQFSGDYFPIYSYSLESIMYANNITQGPLACVLQRYAPYKSPLSTAHLVAGGVFVLSIAAVGIALAGGIQ